MNNPHCSTNERVYQSTSSSYQEVGRWGTLLPPPPFPFPSHVAVLGERGQRQEVTRYTLHGSISGLLALIKAGAVSTQPRRQPNWHYDRHLLDLSEDLDGGAREFSIKLKVGVRLA